MSDARTERDNEVAAMARVQGKLEQIADALKRGQSRTIAHRKELWHQLVDIATEQAKRIPFRGKRQRAATDLQSVAPAHVRIEDGTVKA